MDLRRLCTYKIQKSIQMTYQTALPSEVEKIKQAKRELAMTAAKRTSVLIFFFFYYKSTVN